MLVLTRRLGEQVVIEHGRIVIRVLQIESGAVKLSFDAAPEIPIHRREIQDRVDVEREAMKGFAVADKMDLLADRTRRAIERINLRRVR